MTRPRLIEIRSYVLLPGRAADFHATFVAEALPLLRAAGIEVVAFGPSPHDADAWFLVRAFDDLAQRTAAEDAFYGSDAWKRGPREAIVGAIDRHLDTLLWTTPDAIDDLRRLNRAG